MAVPVWTHECLGRGIHSLVRECEDEDAPCWVLVETMADHSWEYIAQLHVMAPAEKDRCAAVWLQLELCCELLVERSVAAARDGVDGRGGGRRGVRHGVCQRGMFVYVNTQLYAAAYMLSE